MEVSVQVANEVQLSNATALGPLFDLRPFSDPIDSHTPRTEDCRWLCSKWILFLQSASLHCPVLFLSALGAVDILVDSRAIHHGHARSRPHFCSGGDSEQYADSLVVDMNSIDCHYAALFDISQLLNTGLDKETLATCVSLIESGVNPEALAVRPYCLDLGEHQR